MKKLISVLVILSMVLTGCASSSTVRTVSRGPAPMPFERPIKVMAQSYPIHPKQTFTLNSQGEKWNGKTVKLYYMPTTESNNEELMYKKVLPPGAQYIGSSEIKDGSWNFEWKAPQKIKTDNSRYGSLQKAISSKTYISNKRL